MRKWMSALTAFALMISLSVPAFAELKEPVDEEYYSQLRGQNVSINVFNWGEYISDGSNDSVDINKEFENLTGIKVNYSTFATNEELYSKLRSGGASYDVIIPSDYMIARMIREDMLLPLDSEKIPNLRYILPDFFNPIYDPESRYSVPYTWGVVGIIYNTTMVFDEVDSWDILWDEKYYGQILMFSNPRDAFGIALAREGYSLNTENKDELADALEQLKLQKPLVQAYVMDEIFDKMLGGEAALAPYYAGDAVTMMDENPDLDFAIPKEGTNKFVDAMCIPKGSTNPLAAQMYINFMAEPEISAANGEYIGYAIPNSGALELMDEEVITSVAYPPEELMDTFEYFNEMPRETNLLMDSMWTQLLSTNEQYSRMLVPMLLLFGILLSVGINVYRMFNKKRRQKKY
ncbi:ABC transporter substrate-binding protein [Oscillospiraceae bacterium MB08-C2-2]|nr:ABC transporter substrate-binding protein [Oscillospiraceae bacterium MB08-C2-2]